MSVTDVPAVQDASDRLRALLATAETVKKTTSIDPPLPGASFEEQVAAIRPLPPKAPDAAAIAATAGPASKGTDAAAAAASTAHFAVLEAAARNIFYELLSQHDIDQPSFVRVWNLLDLLQICADRDQCEPTLALWLVEELLDAQTIAGCRRVFDYLESRRAALITNNFSKNKQMIVLRSCNELLRRLSRAEDAVFCGRVFIFLFQSFPLGDKSAVNLRGEFHVENKTIFDDIEKVPEAEKMAVDGEESAAEATLPSGPASQTGTPKAEPNGEQNGSKRSKSREEKKEREEEEDTPIETLYPIFWSLQHAFSNPPSLFNDENLETFKKGLHLTIQKFKTVPNVISTSSRRANGSSTNGTTDGSTSLGKRKRDGPDLATNSDLSSAFNPKYLTSFDLFALELSDLTFQRHILVQSLILLEFLLSLTNKAKARQAALRAQKSLQYSFTLSEENEKWAVATRTLIANYIKAGPDGNFYYRMVDNILSRDRNWLRWKIESCPPITRDPLSTDAVNQARSGTAGRCRVKRLRPNPMGAIDLGFLSSSEALSAAYLAEARPSADELVRKAQEVDLDIDFILPVGEELAKRDADIAQKESEVKGRPPPTLAEERAKYRGEHSTHIQEKAGYEAERASRTWRLLRRATRSRFAQLVQVDESKDVTSLGQEVAAETEKKADDDAKGQGDEHDKVSAAVAGDGAAKGEESETAGADTKMDEDEKREPDGRPQEAAAASNSPRDIELADAQDAAG